MYQTLFCLIYLGLLHLYQKLGYGEIINKTYVLQ